MSAAARTTFAQGRRAGATDPAGPAGRLQRQGDFWTIGYRGSTFHLKHSKGLAQLAQLLSRPHAELHVHDLLGPPVLGSALGRGTPDVGPVLDATAKAAYRARLEDLRSERDEATCFGDQERAARAAEEIFLLARELGTALGLGGRDRRAAAVSERARVNVTRTLRAVIAHIARSNAELGWHLAASVRTGSFCSYSPAPGAPDLWDVL